MTIERLVLICVWAACLITPLLFIPRPRSREAILVFFANQVITWLLSLLLVEFDVLQNPVREFPAATGSNFTNNYILYPLVTTIFYLYYPARRGWLAVFAYQAAFIAGSCVYVHFIASYTQLVVYMHYSIWKNALLFLAGVNVTRFYSDWYLQKKRQRGLA